MLGTGTSRLLHEEWTKRGRALSVLLLSESSALVPGLPAPPESWEVTACLSERNSSQVFRQLLPEVKGRHIRQFAVGRIRVAHPGAPRGPAHRPREEGLPAPLSLLPPNPPTPPRLVLVLSTSELPLSFLLPPRSTFSGPSRI